MTNLVYFLKSIRKILIYKSNDKIHNKKKILITGGYGYGNTGDEAQLNATIKLLSARYPEYQIVVLSPDPDYTFSEHGINTDFASRVAFFNQSRECNCYDFNYSTSNTFVSKLLFLFSSFLVMINAHLVRSDLPTLFINARKALFLQKLYESSLLFFCGGGYLTGPTLSRLWDGMLLCRLCRVFYVPVVMSGQTIGIWMNAFNRRYAKKCFRYVNIITVRDEKYSLEDLKEIGLYSEKSTYSTHDDALFSEKTSYRLLKGDYFVINFHYWGMSEHEKNIYIDKIKNIIEYILQTTCINIIFIPMHQSDMYSYNDFISKYPNNRFSFYEYDYDFRKIRRVIADSLICITMKHHPIIFSMGENVPVICLNFSDYYIHKNIGALTQYNQEKFCVNLSDKGYLEKFCELFNECLNNRDKIANDISNSKEKLIQRKNRFLSDVDKILK